MLKATFKLPKNSIKASFSLPSNNINARFSVPISGGTYDYNLLRNLPTINDVELKGELTSTDLGLLDSTALIGYATEDYVNSQGFIDKTVDDLINYYTKLEVNQLIASIPRFSVSVVDELPETGEAMVLYLVPKTGTSPDVYNEYIWITESEEYELIGSTAVDLTGYIKNTANGTNSITINGTATNGNYAINIGPGTSVAGYSVSIGNNTVATGGYSVAIGNSASSTGTSAVALGRGAKAQAVSSVAIGRDAQVSHNYSIQIGKGTNNVAYTLNVGFDSNNYQLLNGSTGLIPDTRISSNIARTSDVQTLLNAKQDILTAGTDIQIVTGALHNLPSGYTEVEYITTDGTAYINTGITVADTDTLDISFTDTSSATTVMFITGRNGSDGAEVYFISPSSSLVQWKGRPSTFTLAKNVEYNIILKSGEFTYTNSLGTTTKTFTGGSVSSTGTCLIGAGWSGTNTIDSRKFIGNISKWQIKDSSNNLRFDGIPCKNSSDIYGLYDIISNTFFPSIGTNDFTGGNEVVPGTVINFTGTIPTKTSDLTNDSGYIANTATGSNAITINGTATTKTQAINIGSGSQVTGNYGIAVGCYAYGNGSQAIGLGNYAKATANYAIQIGKGTNSTASTLQIGFDGTSYKLLDGTGTVYATNLQIGNTTLSEAQLQSLLALI